MSIDDPDDQVAAVAAATPSRQAALRSGAIGVAVSVLTQATSTITTIVLARLLVPSDIGLVAAAAVVLGLFEVVSEFGLGASVIRRRHIDDTVLSTTFWTSAGLGLAVVVTAAALSPWLASAVRDERAAGVIALIAAASGLSFVRMVPNGLLKRELQFGAVYGVTAVANVSYAAVTITLAAATDLGPYAIVVGRLVQSVIEAGGSFVASGWRPSARFDRRVLWADAGFNAGFWANGLALYASKNIDYWVVGRAFGAASLGVYYVAYVLPNIIRQRVTWVAQDVLFPSLSRIDDPDRLERGYLEAVRVIALVTYPLMFGLAASADSVVHGLFGERWADAVMPLRLLALGSALDALSAPANSYLLSRGMPARSMQANLTRAVVLLVGALVAVQLDGDLAAIAAVVLAATAAAGWQWMRTVRDVLGVGGRRTFAAITPALAASVVMALLVLALDLAVAWGPLITLGISVVAGGAIYAGVLLLVDRRAVLDDVRELRAVMRRRQR